MAYFRCDSNSDSIGNINFPGGSNYLNLYYDNLPAINPAYNRSISVTIPITITKELSDRVVLTGGSSWGNDDHTIINIIAQSGLKIGANQGNRYYTISVSGFSII